MPKLTSELITKPTAEPVSLPELMSAATPMPPSTPTTTSIARVPRTQTCQPEKTARKPQAIDSVIETRPSP